MISNMISLILNLKEKKLPKYDYRCKDCGHETMIIHKMSEQRTECPKCKSENFFKVFLADSMKTTGIKLKGTGWTGKIYK